MAPIHLLNEIGPGTFKKSAKFVHNCEYRLFQRPDDAIHRGFDKQTEKDFREREILSVILNASIKKMQKNKYQKHLLLKSIPTRCRN